MVNAGDPVDSTAEYNKNSPYVLLYLELRALEAEGAYLHIEQGHQGVTWVVKLRAATHDAYLQHTRSVLQSNSNDVVDESCEDAEEFKPASQVEREGGGIPKVQAGFLRRILKEAETGKRKPVHEWRPMTQIVYNRKRASAMANTTLNRG